MLQEKDCHLLIPPSQVGILDSKYFFGLVQKLLSCIFLHHDLELSEPFLQPRLLLQVLPRHVFIQRDFFGGTCWLKLGQLVNNFLEFLQGSLLCGLCRWDTSPDLFSFQFSLFIFLFILFLFLRKGRFLDVSCA